MSVTPDDVKAAMRLWASGVTIVATANDSERAGTTASSFTSVSLEPPLILVCLYHGVAVTQQLERNGHFAVSVLGEHDTDLSAQMAGYKDVPPGEDRFYGYDWTSHTTGSPVFAGSNAWFDCTLHAVHDGGTHKIVVGQVVAVGRKPADAVPLLYFNRGYPQLATRTENA